MREEIFVARQEIVALKDVTCDAVVENVIGGAVVEMVISVSI